jgi:C terminal of Calcineurin-like phosphoesterase/N terminal of Calcineurin-like phosphoesterase
MITLPKCGGKNNLLYKTTTMERRSFLKNFSLAGALLTVPPALAEAATFAAPVKKDIGNITLKGKVQSKGTGIAGIAVTDGNNITLTDKNGNYELLSNNTAEFVYISMPSAYQFNNDKGIAKFYVPVNTSSNSFKADFELEKLAVDDKQHCFVVWADTQMISEKDVELLKAQSVPDLQQLVAAYPKQTLFHGIGCGDLVWDKFELFEGYKQAIDTTGVTFFNVIGNHDMDLDARTDELSAKTFKKQFGPTYYSFNRGDIHYVVLDDVFFIGTAKQYIGYITENQLQWLEQDLLQVKPGTTVVVSLHIPTNTGAARRNKKDAELGSVVSNRKQLYKILSPYKVHIMSGHTHFNDTWEENNIMEHNHGTVCGAWWTGPVCGDGTPNGYGVYEVNGSDINWYYKSTGLPKTNQLRLYGKGRSKNNPDEITANVWNWDVKWKVEWLEDGVAKGAMEQRVALDPLAVELYAGPELPKKHKFVEPTLADHIFFATPSANAKQIEVRVTDRFGNIFSEKLSLA